MKTHVAQHYRMNKQLHFVRSSAGLQHEKLITELSASTFARNGEIWVPPNGADVKTGLRLPVRSRVAPCGRHAVGVGGQTYIGQMTAVSEMRAVPRPALNTNGASQIAANAEVIW